MSAEPSTSEMLVWATTIVACVLVAGGTYYLMTLLRTRVRVVRRIHAATEGVSGLNGLQNERRMADSATELKSTIGNSIASFGRLMPLGEEGREKIVLSLNRAGYLSTNALAIVLGTKLAGLAAGMVIGLVVLASMFSGVAGFLGGLVGGVLVGVLLNVVPEAVLGQIASRRLRRISAGLAETFDLLVVCLESGLTFDRALKRTVDNLKWFQPDLAKEFGSVVLDMSVHGRTSQDALGRLAKRLDNQDFRDLAVTVSQSQRHGTPLADALRKLSSSVRVAQIARMQEKMARLPTLLILPSIACILPGIMVIVGGPSFMELMDSMSTFGD